MADEALKTEPEPQTPAKPDGAFHKVDEKTQEQAGKEREESGGYD